MQGDVARAKRLAACADSAAKRGDASAAQAHMAQHLQCCADRVRPEAPADFDLRSVLGRRGGKDKV